MYTFKLQAVLDHRQFIEERLEKELADIRGRIMAERQQLQSLQRKEMKSAEALKQEQAEGGLSSDGVLAYQAYLKRLSEQMVRHQSRLREIQACEADAQRELIEAMKRRQILEKLKQQGLDRYNQAVQKTERNWIDEIAVNRYARQTIQKSGEGQ